MPTSRRSTSLQIRLERETVRIGPLTVRFNRTLRLPDDGRRYPLPPSLGAFPIHRVADHLDRVPESWRAHGGVFIPMHQREALWLGFSGSERDPVALKVAAGMRNALTGGAWDEEIAGGRDQDYVVVPGQPWIDGFNSGEGFIRQFIAMPLGMGYTAEGQLTGEERFGGIQLLAFGACPGAIEPPPPDPPRVVELGSEAVYDMAYSPAPASPAASAAPRAQALRAARGAEMGLAAGGRMTQRIHPDPHGADVWDSTTSGRLFVHIVDPVMYRHITGRHAPDSPISAQTYAQHGLPWFQEWSDAGDIAPSDDLAGLKSVGQKDAEHGFELQDDSTVEIDPSTVKGVGGGRFSDPVG